jgi:phosphoglucosamine mutase
MGLGEALKKMGIENAITGVGDRYVMEEMRQRGAVLGGEESGHTVFTDHQTTGRRPADRIKASRNHEHRSKNLFPN